MKLKKLIIKSCLFWAIIAMLACNKEIDLTLPAHKSRLIVEGWIEQDKGPKVILSLSAPFFTSIDSSNLRDYAVTKARVTIISGQGEKEILTLKPNEIYFPPYYYFGTELIGSLGSEYTLEIDFQGNKYSAKTAIPNLVEIDSSWFQKEMQSDSLGGIFITFRDNPKEKNYYRVSTKRLNKDARFIPTFNSLYSDNSFAPDKVSISLLKGNVSLLDLENDNFLK